MCRMTFWFIALWVAASALPPAAKGEPPVTPDENAAALLAKVRETLQGLKSYRFERTTTIEEAAADGKRTPVAELTFVTIADFQEAARDADFPDEPGTVPLPVPFQEGRFRFEHARDFTIHAMDRQGNRTVIAPVEKSAEYKINSELILWDLETGKREPIGKGHSACIFDNGKVLFFTGYERDAWIWESGHEPRKIEAPAAVFDVPHRIVGNRAAVSATMQSNEPIIFVFDAEAEKFEKVSWQIASGIK